MLIVAIEFEPDTDDRFEDLVAEKVASARICWVERRGSRVVIYDISPSVTGARR